MRCCCLLLLFAACGPAAEAPPRDQPRPREATRIGREMTDGFLAPARAAAERNRAATEPPR
jgi:hypothetical protein